MDMTCIPWLKVRFLWLSRSMYLLIYGYDLYSVVESEVSLTIMMNDLNVFSSNDKSIIIFLVLHYNGSKTINKNEKQITSLRRCDNIYDVRSKKRSPLRHQICVLLFLGLTNKKLNEMHFSKIIWWSYTI